MVAEGNLSDRGLAWRVGSGSRNIVLQYYSSTFAVLWDRVEAAGVSCPDPVVSFFKGVLLAGVGGE